MKWQTKDVDEYFHAREYIDTAIIPLLPIQWNDELKSSVAMGEFISLISEGLERQLRGRVYLLPSFSYVKSEDRLNILPNLLSIETELKENGIKHIIYLTCDSDWKRVEEKLATLIWLPSLPLQHVKQENKLSILEEQVKEVMKLVMDEWKT
ncbi:hypothetical protein CIB95_07405 [Lottiidibacillus patelloidae]|uniref:DUF2487 domain-containing protein n=1 Tax=Lottiidibacillus patelloidae TaxID=2670334 RepID=A0A263BUR1_9BACI|nr:YpiF family protein [Lottiidibacillus patelloidae]OZM57282.1 hypothetical protein CIB95_07405 [Lottiidibacillus patelloidae]